MTREGISTVRLASGRVRYRFTVDVGRDPATGRRQQRRYTFDTKRAAVTERARILAAVAAGAHVDRDRVTTVADLIEAWLALQLVKRKPVRANTLRGYRSALSHAVKAFGAVRAQDLTRRDVEALVTSMSKAGKAPRTVSLTLTLVKAVLADAAADGTLCKRCANPRNPSACDTSVTRQLQRWERVSR